MPSFLTTTINISVHPNTLPPRHSHQHTVRTRVAYRPV